MLELSVATLTHTHARLEPLAETHRTELIEAAATDTGLFRHMPSVALAGGYPKYLDWLLQQHAAGRLIAFTVFASQGGPVGNTCYLDIRPFDAGVEIGSTWYVPAAQGTLINPAAKLLLLAHAFASGAERVALKTDALNARSRAAILKLGATFEGVHRRHMRRADGSWRDTAWYSILREEWPAVRAGLEQRLAAPA